jgi:hypothetical protein
LGGEIYYRAIGRPGAGGRLHSLQSSLAGGPGRPRAVGATRAFKFESGRQRLLRVRPTIRGPPARAVRLSDRPTRTVCDCLSAPGRWSARLCALCARKGCCLVKQWFLHKNKLAYRCCHRVGKRLKMNNRKPKNVELVLPTPFHTPRYTHDLGIAISDWQAAKAACERSEPLAHASSSQAGRRYSGPPSAGHQPKPSGRLQVSIHDCNWCCYRAGKRFKMVQSKTKECGARFADTVWNITIHTRFGTSHLAN